jgi:hypothetical protein
MKMKITKRLDTGKHVETDTGLILKDMNDGRYVTDDGVMYADHQIGVGQPDEDGEYTEYKSTGLYTAAEFKQNGWNWVW